MSLAPAYFRGRYSSRVGVFNLVSLQTKLATPALLAGVETCVYASAIVKLVPGNSCVLELHFFIKNFV